jgi:thiol-disulfide isomerase/thioredoxin
MSSILDIYFLLLYDEASSVVIAMKKYVIIGVIVAVAGLGVSMASKPERMQKKEGIVSESMMKKSDSEVMEKMDGAMMKKQGTYAAYSGTLAPAGKQVLFFHASWCPTCRSADTDITSKLSDIPADVTIHKVDYDDSSELKKKYGVTYQHTFVQVDEKGEMIAKWSSGDLDTIIQKIK